MNKQQTTKPPPPLFFCTHKHTHIHTHTHTQKQNTHTHKMSYNLFPPPVWNEQTKEYIYGNLQLRSPPLPRKNGENMPKVCESCSLPLPKSQHASTIEYWCSVLEKKIERAAEARRSITDLVIGQERISWRHDLLELEMQTANEIAELYRRRGYECTIDVWENTSNGNYWQQF